MSTNWGFRCPVHEAGNAYMKGGSGDSGLRSLVELWRRREKLIALRKLDMEFLSAFANEESYNRTAIYFLAEHGECDGLYIEDEYGGRRDPADPGVTILRRSGDVVRDLTELIASVEGVTPSPRGVVYVGDLRAVLFGTPAVSPKVGMNDDGG